MKEGTRQFTEKDSSGVLERVKLLCGLFLAFGLLHLHVSFIYLKKVKTLFWSLHFKVAINLVHIFW